MNYLEEIQMLIGEKLKKKLKGFGIKFIGLC